MLSALKIFLIAFTVLTFHSEASVLKVGAVQKYKSLSSALESANAYDTIIVDSGIFETHPLKIKIPITIIGSASPELIAVEGKEIITILSDSVTITGFRFSGVNTSYLKENAAIRIKDSGYFTIDSCYFDSCFFAIYIEHSSKGVISNNTIIGNAVEEMSSGNAIHAWHCKDLVIYSNLVKQHRDGIYLEFVENSVVHSNVSVNNIRYGLHFMFSNHNKYMSNRFEENGAGVAVMFSKHIEIYLNEFVNNWGTNSYGLLLKEIYDTEIYSNYFDKNTVGIFIEGSTRIKYLNNSFENNGWAIKMSGGCLNNEFEKNNFISNSFDFSVSSNFNNNTITNNYWSDYSGYDLDKNGYGDVAHRPINLFSFITQQSRESIILNRSMFVDLINFAEKVTPVFTPVDVFDSKPAMYPYEFSFR